MLEIWEGATRIFLKLFPEAVPTGRPFETAVKDAVDEIKVRAPKVAREPSGQWGFHDKDAWEKYVVYLGLDPKQVDPAGFYTNEFIPDVNKFDEAKVREQAKGYKLPN